MVKLDRMAQAAYSHLATYQNDPFPDISLARLREKMKDSEPVMDKDNSIDYGYRNHPGYFTLQSVYNNKRSNVLDNIGKQDITSLIDFNKLIDLGKKNNLKIEHFSSQREFLLNNGIKERENKILKVANNKQRIMVQKGVKRIIDKKDMGNLFKVLVLSKWN